MATFSGKALKNNYSSAIITESPISVIFLQRFPQLFSPRHQLHSLIHFSAVTQTRIAFCVMAVNCKTCLSNA